MPGRFLQSLFHLLSPSGQRARRRSTSKRRRRLAYERLEDRSLLAGNAFGQCFDFGTTGSPVESGCTQVADRTAYSSALGYGWRSGTIRSVDRGTGGALERDLNYTGNGTFGVDVPNGSYNVELTLGDRGAYAHDQMGVYFEGRQVDNVSTAAGQIVTRSYEVEVGDGQLTLQLRDLGGRDANIVIVGLRVSAAGPALPALSIGDASRAEGNQGTSPWEFTVSLSQASEQAVSVHWSTVGNTATSPADFVAASGVLTIPAGMTGGTIAVTVNGDLDVEPNETFWVDLSQPSGVTLGKARGLGTIVNDDEPDPIALAADFDFGTASSPVAAGYMRVADTTGYSTALGYGWTSGTIRSVDRGTGSALDRDLNYTGNGIFAVAVPNGLYAVTLTLGDLGSYAHDQMGVYLEGRQVDNVSTAAGQIVTRSYEVEVRDGQLTLQLRDLGGRDANIVTTSLRVRAAGPILPVLSIGDASRNEGNQGTSLLEFTVTLSQASQQTVSVNWSTVANSATSPSDFAAASGVLSFPAGTTTGQIAVTVNGDEDVEPTETFWVDLSQPNGATLGKARGTGTIVNDDVPQVPVEFATYFDFGTPTSLVTAGYTRVSEATVYSPALGYGWQTGVVRSVDRGGWGALDRDLIYTADATFLLDLPNGTYDVELLLGDRGAYAHDQVGVYLENQLRDTVTTAARQQVAKRYEVTVTDGQLSLRLFDLGGGDKNACIEALRVVASGNAPAANAPWWPVVAEIPGSWFSDPVRDANGFLVHTIESPYQSGPVLVRVLLPTTLTPGKQYKTVYVLPVESGAGTQYGDGLVTVKSQNLHNIYDAIFVAPTFSALPWYADHVSNHQIWQETHFRTVVAPFVEQRYPAVSDAEGRLLLGFSKSGYGAFTMLLRHPDFFGKALAWDSALAMSDPSTGYGYTNILGSSANFANYRIPSLLQQRAAELRDQPVRLYLRGYGYDYTRRDHLTIHNLVTNLGIPHDYKDGVARKHVWHSGWVPEAVDLLLS